MDKPNIKAFFVKNELRIIIISVVVFIAFYGLIFVMSRDENYHILEKDYISYIDEVNVYTGENKGGDIKLPKTIDVDGEFDIYLNIEDYLGKDNLSIYAWFPYCTAKIYVDDKVIFELKKQENSIVRSGAYTGVIFDVPDNIKNPKIKIRVKPTLDRVKSHKIEKFIIGRKSDIIVNMLRKDFSTIVISIFLIINLIFSISVNIRIREFLKVDHYSVFYLSILGFQLGFYFLTQTPTVTYFLGRYNDFLYFVEYAMLMSVFIPALMYTKHKVDVKFSGILNFIAIIRVLNIIIQTVLTLFWIIEFKELIYITHFTMYIDIVVIFFSIVFTDSKKYPAKKTLLIPIATILASILVPLIYYTIFKIHIIINLGLITVSGLIVLEIVEIYKKYVDYRKHRLEKEFYKKIAMTDSLTGLRNRKSYEEFVLSIETNRLSGWIVSLDINNLKYINDKFGHIMGDKLIVDFANLLNSRNLNINFNSFRIGGDEFFVFIKGKKGFDINAFINQLKSDYSNASGYEEGFKPSFSAGYHYYNGYDSESVMDIYNIADKHMYKDKILFKEQNKKYIY